ncbi:uncharacterized protein LOC116261060 [Nymphaea colorata]|nr:uncharacterized protein LOC116261060 [Nymphaea colorata]
MAETTAAAMAARICNQINSVFVASSQAALDVLVEEIAAVAARDACIIVHGVGREGLIMKALCMRLAHLGLRTHCVGDMSAPPVSPKDLLIASAGPGGFPTVDAICQTAKRVGATVVVVTAQRGGSASRLADRVAFLPAQTMADDQKDCGGGGGGLLPMGSLYEGAMFVLFEMVIFRLASALGQSPEVIRSRHTNLE